jgi:hypothetical protein
MKRVMIAGLAAALVLAGCAADPPQVETAPTAAARAALDESMASAIVEETFAALGKADRAGDASLLAPRIGGDAALVRTAEYKVAAAVADEAPQLLPSSMQRIYVSNATSWPRVLAAVSAAPEDNLTPVIYVWVQDDVSSPYELRGWAHMIPGATVPAMPGDVDGATQLPLGESGVDPSPRAALEGYIEYLRQGPESEHAASYEPDTYAQQLFTARESLSAAASQAGGAYVDTVQPDLANTFVLSTGDGGALVIAPVLISSSFSVSGATLTLSAHDAPLLDGSLSTKVTYAYRDLVVLSVPAPGKGQLPGVVAAEHHLVSVKPE